MERLLLYQLVKAAALSVQSALATQSLCNIPAPPSHVPP